MAGVCLPAVAAGLLLTVCGLAAEITEENTGDVFVSQQAAHAVLRRQRRYNSGLEEVLHKDNLERECMEEVCSMEEAREVFENDEKTMEFWVTYIDGNQCQPNPCQNDGSCEDGVSSYTCWCKPNFSGKNCEIEVAKQCAVDNGGCSHFCVMQGERPVCQCAAGYRLGADKRSCEPTGPFSCGQVTMAITRSILTRVSSNTTTASGRSLHFNGTLHYDDYDYNETQLSEYELLSDPEPLNASAASAAKARSARSDPGASASPAEDAAAGGGLAGRAMGNPVELKPFFPTIPPIADVNHVETRIVGGDEAIPGEIPWQVTLMSQSSSLGRAQPFCGGSLLSELWVITAAHCLVQARIANLHFFVRVGEHDVSVVEGPERDHAVAEQVIHHKYDYNTSPYNHDIALLRLATPVELSDRARPICLGPKDFTETILRESSTSLVSGWGRLKFQGIEANKLQKLEVPHVDRTKCKQSSRSAVTRFMFCAGFHSQQKDSCQGDSGGPHATKYKGTWFLTGIVSWGEECAKDGKYGIYTRVSRYNSWITQTTGIQMK